MKKKVTAVFDIGNINKKLILFDENFEVVEIFSTRFNLVKDDDGFEADDLESIKRWSLDIWDELLQNDGYEVTALNFTTYGATMVHIDENGEDVTPLYSYIKEFPKELEEKFYTDYGEKLTLALETCSPPLGLLNSSLQIYWLKYAKPEMYEKIAYSLHFPQYMAHLFTKKVITEYTSIGCHTAMWNFRRRDYHNWIKEEKIIEKIPDFAVRPVLDYKEYYGKTIPIGTGIHDTSSALRTYLFLFDKSFLLMSFTGTWCITLNPFDHTPLREEDLIQDCLQYLTVQGRRIKASRFFLGNEHEYQTKRMAKYFDKSEQYFMDVVFDDDIYENINEQAATDGKTLKPHYFTNTGRIKDKTDLETQEDWDLNQFSSYEEAYHRFIYDFVQFMKPAINITARKRFPDYLIVDGGYGKNEVFLNTLSETYSEMTIMTTDIPEGIAMGAALFINQYLNPNMKKPTLQFKEY